MNVGNLENNNAYVLEGQKCYLGKNTKKNKKYEIFQGVTFCFWRLVECRFFDFLFRNRERKPEVTHSGRGRILTIYHDARAGGPEAPSDHNFKSS